MSEKRSDSLQQSSTQTNLNQWFGLEGKVALVTGASSGLGVVFAEALAEAGAKVAVVARRIDRLDSLQQRLSKKDTECAAIAMDVTDAESVMAGLQQIQQQLGTIDILVNNAGIADFGRAEKASDHTFQSVLDINLLAAFRLAREVGNALIQQQKPGAIINIASVIGMQSNPIFPTVAYSASKGGLIAMTHQLAREWAAHSVRVNAIAPAWFPTEMNIDPRHQDIPPKYKERMIERTPAGRLGELHELKGAVVFLASPAASYITGAVLPVDGGWLT